METVKVNLTNETLRKRFSTSQFDLVGYAIKLAENMIKTGRSPRIKSDKQNIAMIILEEIAQGKDEFEPIIEKEVAYNPEPDAKKYNEMHSLKASEKKKPRKILAD